MKKIEIFTDGACKGNPGPGGWGSILSYNGYEKEISGGSPSTTNNKMELTALIEALKLLKEPCDITVYTDSKYLCDGLEKGWAKSWKKNNWIKSDKKPALNADLWDEILNFSNIHKIKIIWIKGHNGHPKNERCDMLAVKESAKYK